VIAVSASTSLGKKAAYSNWGQEISIAAPSSNGHPGTGRRPTYPLVTDPLPGRGIVTTDRIGPAGYSASDYTFDFGGTSSACPTAAGVAALVISANPRLTAKEVREVLESTSDRIIDPDPDPQLGLEHGSYDEKGHSLWFGHGKVNAFRAVTEAVRRHATEPVESLRKMSAPALAIPDHDPSGIKDTLHFDRGAIISDVRVQVDITHSFIGDLRVILLSPSGTAVLLHEREGGGNNDLKETFDLATVPGLSALFGETAQGDWDLLVQDLAPIDTGILERWELEIDVRSEAVVILEEAPGIAIPDNDPAGIERSLANDRAGRLREISVDLDITHSFVRDLVVTLVSPSGTAVPLHERSGGSADNLIRTYSLATTPALHALDGEGIEGTWRLRVADEAGIDEGKLNRWALSIVAAP
jgi:subtilisin-like proprotein convertase family protein